MALKLGWFAVRNVQAPGVVSVLERAKELVRVEDRPSGFRIINAPVARPSFIDSLLRRPAPAPFATIMLVGRTFSAAPVWAEAASRDLAEPAVAFVVDGTWTYAVFDRGERILELQGGQRPTLVGDVAKAASILGVDAEILERPLKSVEYRADEWAHLDLARRLGRVAGPGPDTAIEIDWSRSLPSLSPRDLDTELDTGDRCMHAENGLGEIVKVDRLDGQLFYEVTFTTGTIELPREAIRPLMTESVVKATFDVLREPEPEEESSAERLDRYVELSRIGTGPALAEIVRDLTRKEARGASLAPGERRALEHALSQLAAEIAAIRQTSASVIRSDLVDASRRR